MQTSVYSPSGMPMSTAGYSPNAPQYNNAPTPYSSMPQGAYSSGYGAVPYTTTAGYGSIPQSSFTSTSSPAYNGVPQMTYNQGYSGIPQSSYSPGIPQQMAYSQGTYSQGMPQTTYSQGMPQTTYSQGMPQTTYSQGMPQTTYTSGSQVHTSNLHSSVPYTIGAGTSGHTTQGYRVTGRTSEPQYSASRVETTTSRLQARPSNARYQPVGTAPVSNGCFVVDVPPAYPSNLVEMFESPVEVKVSREFFMAPILKQFDKK